MKYIFLIGFAVCQLWAGDELPTLDLESIEAKFTNRDKIALIPSYKAETNPQSKAALMREAIAYSGVDYSSSIDFLLHTLRLDPENRETLFALGKLYNVAATNIPYPDAGPEERLEYRERACAYFMRVIKDVEEIDRHVALNLMSYRDLTYNFASDVVRKPIVTRFLAEHPEVRKVTFFPHINAALYCAEQAEARGRFLDRGRLMEYVQDKIKDLERRYDASISCTPEEYDEVWEEAAREEAARAELESSRETEPRDDKPIDSTEDKIDRPAPLAKSSSSAPEISPTTETIG